MPLFLSGTRLQLAQRMRQRRFHRLDERVATGEQLEDRCLLSCMAAELADAAATAQPHSVANCVAESSAGETPIANEAAPASRIPGSIDIAVGGSPSASNIQRAQVVPPYDAHSRLAEVLAAESPAAPTGTIPANTPGLPLHHRVWVSTTLPLQQDGLASDDAVLNRFWRGLGLALNSVSDPVFHLGEFLSNPAPISENSNDGSSIDDVNSASESGSRVPFERTLHRGGIFDDSPLVPEAVPADGPQQDDRAAGADSANP